MHWIWPVNKARGNSCSHRIGKPILSKPLPILVKFVSYHSRQKFNEGCEQIADKYPYIRINDELTKATNNLTYKPRELHWQRRLQHIWVQDRKVFVYTYGGRRATVISNECELTHHLLPTIYIKCFLTLSVASPWIHTVSLCSLLASVQDWGHPQVNHTGTTSALAQTCTSLNSIKPDFLFLTWINPTHNWETGHALSLALPRAS